MELLNCTVFRHKYKTKPNGISFIDTIKFKKSDCEAKWRSYKKIFISGMVYVCNAVGSGVAGRGQVWTRAPGRRP